MNTTILSSSLVFFLACMAFSLFNSTSHFFNLHTLKPKNLLNYAIKPNSSNFIIHQQNDKKSFFTNLSILCKNGRIFEALEVLSQMNNNGIKITPEFYVELLQGCIFDQNLSLGQQIHGVIIKNGGVYAKNEYILTKLLIFYAKCECLDNANKLFSRMSSRNVFSWAAMIGLNSRMGENDETLVGFCEFLESGLVADNFVIPNVFKACGANKCVLFGRSVHGYVIKTGTNSCVYVASSLVDMYGKCGGIDDAEVAFDQMIDKSVVVWNSMMASYVQNGMNEEGIQMFYDMMCDGVEPTRVSISSLMSASANLRALAEGKQGHAVAVLYGLELDPMLGSALINFYSKLGLVEDVELVFSKMVEKDAVTWNLLISCYVRHRIMEDVVHTCRTMRLHGLEFDCVTMASIFSSCGKNNEVKLGKEGHGYCLRHGFHLDNDVVGSLIDMYAKTGNLEYAKRVFESVGVEPNVVIWSTYLSGLAQNGSGYEAVLLFRQMQEAGIRPNAASLTALLSTCIDMTSLLIGKAVHGYAIRRWRQFSVEIQTSLINMYAKCGSTTQAINVFNMTSDNTLA